VDVGVANPAHMQDVAFLPDRFRAVKQSYSTLETSYRTTLAPAIQALPSNNVATTATAMAIATYRFMSSLLVCKTDVRAHKQNSCALWTQPNISNFIFGLFLARPKENQVSARNLVS